MELTKQNKVCAETYRKCNPKQLGNLHERMQYVMEMLRRDRSQAIISNDLWHAIHDLETEVSFYTPQSPPYGRRTTGLDWYCRR